MSDFRGGRGGGGQRGNYQGGRGGHQSGSERGGYQQRGGYQGRGGFQGGRGGYQGAPDQNAPMPASSRVENLINQQLERGTIGQPVELLANYFKINTSDMKVYHYDVYITKERKNGNGKGGQPSGDYQKPPSPTSGEKPPSPTGSVSSDTSEEMSVNLERFIKKFSSQIVEQLVKECKHFQGVETVYDGCKNLYVVRKLEFNGDKALETIVTIQVDGRNAEFKVTLKLVNTVLVNEVLDFYSGKRTEPISERTTSIYETVFRFIMGKQYEQFQRKFYDLSTRQSSPKVQLAQFIGGFTSNVKVAEFGSCSKSSP